MRRIFSTTKSVEIDANPETCYRVICDFESYPFWHKNVKSVTIKERDENGKPTSVLYLFDIIIKKGFQTLLEYEYDDINYNLSVRAIGGDLHEAEAHHNFRKLISGKTLTNYKVKGDLGALPPKIINFLVEKVMKGALTAFKEECERIEKEIRLSR